MVHPATEVLRLVGKPPDEHGMEEAQVVADVVAHDDGLVVFGSPEYLEPSRLGIGGPRGWILTQGVQDVVIDAVGWGWQFDSVVVVSQPTMISQGFDDP